jgi:hypothetical protein
MGVKLRVVSVSYDILLPSQSTSAEGASAECHARCRRTIPPHDAHPSGDGMWVGNGGRAAAVRKLSADSIAVNGGYFRLATPDNFPPIDRLQRLAEGVSVYDKILENLSHVKRSSYPHFSSIILAS